MASTAELIQAIRMESPKTIPVSVSLLPAVWIHHGKEAEELVKAFPQFFPQGVPDYSDPGKIAQGRYRQGTYVDDWGCVWSNMSEGMDAIVTGHPLQSEEDIFSLKIPDRRDGDLPHGFMYLRLLDLCGFENAMLLFAEENEALEVLLNKVLTYNKYQIEAIWDRDEQIVSFGDDLGMQKGLAIGAERWRKYLKPCFAELYGMIKRRHPQKLIYMHTDGCIFEIMPDLVECGVDMINPQFRANGLDNLVRVCRKEQIIPINLDLDRQLFPIASRQQLHEHVAECVEALYLPQGGLAINVELNHEVPMENCFAVLEAVEHYRHKTK